ncbi:MAG TPA: glutathionylspermidine synthase family protein, partial [Burkholderiaceae bacterium]|nr:glutathionylspermidine synthase family protein [Burkholderiaceae bacterium]
GEMESIGFHYHSIDGTYWDESRCYVFSEAEIERLESATEELHQMALNAAQQVVGSARYDEFAIPGEWVPAIEQSWNAYRADQPEGFTLFGRMDLSYDGASPPKLLEYNADTPTACLEASVAQWQWLQSVRPNADQFNSLHEQLIAAWQQLRRRSVASRLHFTAVADSQEDWGNIEYLRDTAIQAGWQTFELPVERIGWNGSKFVDEFNLPIEVLVKLYPWEWLVREEFGPALLASTMKTIEPAWKMLLSNKAILAVLWELYPDHPNLLPAYYDPSPLGSKYVKKPKLAREGANVSIVDGEAVQMTDGDYGAEGFMYQAIAPLPKFDNDFALIGSWIVGDKPAGIGVREDASSITRNTSRFVPHYFE